jgi:hypothetical protein
MCDTGRADGLVILQVSGNKTDAVPCERLPFKSWVTYTRMDKNTIRAKGCQKSLDRHGDCYRQSCQKCSQNDTSETIRKQLFGQIPQLCPMIDEYEPRPTNRDLSHLADWLG